MHEIEQTRDFFRVLTWKGFREHVKPRWEGKPILYLEIGVFEGVSLAWMMAHVLTHPESRAVGVDPWLPLPPRCDTKIINEVMLRAERNLKPWEDRCKLYRMNSEELLTASIRRHGGYGIGPASVDVCMIDGSHFAYSVIRDAEMVLPLMKPGGWILFDDVDTDERKVGGGYVYDGLQLFLEKHGDKVKRLWRRGWLYAYEVLG